MSDICTSSTILTIGTFAPSDTEIPEKETKSAAITDANAAAMQQWISLAELLQLKCISLEVAELLQAAGINSLDQLKESVPENLHQRLFEVNNKLMLLDRAPTLFQVTEMIVLAKWSNEFAE